jgi:hypothetical protein
MISFVMRSKLHGYNQQAMTEPMTFDEFVSAFFGIFTQRSFRGVDFLSYLNRPDARRGGDEAAIVDTAIVSPLLGLLGFEAGERVYNQQHLGDRPDFAPSDSVYRTCFIVEDKSTSLALTFDLSDPNSYLSQLSLVGLSAEEQAAIEAIFVRLEQDARAYISPKEFFAEMLAILTQAFQRKHASQPKPPKPPTLEVGYVQLKMQNKQLFPLYP